MKSILIALIALYAAAGVTGLMASLVLAGRAERQEAE